MQVKFDLLLQELLQMPLLATKYLSPTIQNEVILLLANSLH